MAAASTSPNVFTSDDEEEEERYTGNEKEYSGSEEEYLKNLKEYHGSGSEEYSDDGEDEEFFTFNQLLTDQRAQQLFQRWFWTGRYNDHPNCSQLVGVLNAHNTAERVMLEKRSEIWYVYGIVVNNHPFNRDDHHNEHWKLMKIGYTQQDLNENNLIQKEVNVIKEKLVAKYPEELCDSRIGGTTNTNHNPNLQSVNIAILFVSEKSPTDTSTEQEWKDRVKYRFGKMLTKQSAKILGLAHPNDWVFTTQSTINRYKTEADKVKKDKGTHVSAAMKTFAMKPSVRSTMKSKLRFKDQIIAFL